jgi:hypothetical protein
MCGRKPTPEVTMGKNDYLAKQRAVNEAFFTAGLQSGRQQIMDMMSLVLNNPKYVKKDVFGKDRLVIVIQGIGETLDMFQPAWEKSDEADYYQKKMDAALADIYGDSLHDSFYERYKYAPEYDYMKGRWKK